LVTEGGVGGGFPSELGGTGTPANLKVGFLWGREREVRKSSRKWKGCSTPEEEEGDRPFGDDPMIASAGTKNKKK